MRPTNVAPQDFYDRSNQINIGDLKGNVQLANRNTKVSEIKKVFREDEPIKAVVIVSGKKPLGLVMNIHLDRTLSQRFGVALYYDKPIDAIMDVEPLIVDANIPVPEVADMAMNREKSKIFDHIIITEQGEVSGIVSVQDIMSAMSNIQHRYADAMNRVNEQLQKEIDERSKVEDELVTLNQELEERVAKRTSEIQESNQKLKNAVSVAEAANKAKSDFLSNMSHELRTPLNHIIGFTELVLGQHFGGLNETQSEYLTDVLNSSNHLLSLINDILDLSKIEAGKHELFISEIEIRPLLEKSIVMIKEKAQKHRIQITTEFDGVPEIIEGDARKIKQIMYNLLSNAVKFTGDNGRICLHAKRIADVSELPMHQCHPMISACEADLIEISVKDSGIGLKSDDRERIFNPFEQADSAKSRKYQGTGLGLSLTKKLVELHNGFIWVRSDGQGMGSDFRFILPSRQKAGNQAHPPVTFPADACPSIN
ncbi:ATP-binding protein [Desulfosarcina ovata]|uniref:ATP-binding protein n=1 Tax=Desulfosarcina ovata TaxID=83564 RepID=UPI00139197B4|nr:ATP-binding protein [Desulfosarcina ovata]